MKPESSREAICLCTPTPKIPRPRNAFILYRQHHQSQVTADNPKLSNPEISKIIGEKWKHEAEDIPAQERQQGPRQLAKYTVRGRVWSLHEMQWANHCHAKDPFNASRNTPVS
ncbi:uncharacterized protein LMH87_009038 [Akanthomyces muscarius]|uniref:HMG box domain-containing protein n=1 Tax=Akanthomyces muscarius TaxID=2231603 RepID=A0A9W8QKE3_AKAMU|nr:uncharacterized protein LMH87_009038 [Akanthomyces muscarius]KAJ4158515.1 hypothetical protein LMH87_009038 [Akanthomyces muscarius]